VDLNGDGKLDVISGIYLQKGDAQPRAGHPRVAYGIEGGRFGETEPIKNKAGALVLSPLAVGGDPRRVDARILNTATAAGDLNGDGTVDMLVGGSRGNIFFVAGEKSPTGVVWSNTPVSLKNADGSDIEVKARKAGPHLVDWDKDGDLDLLVGSAKGAVYLYRNTGNKHVPAWAASEELLPEVNAGQEQHIDKAKLQRGMNSRVHAVDWNADGKLDLLVGDKTTVIQRRKGLTDEKYNALMKEHARLKKEVDGWIAKYKELGRGDTKEFYKLDKQRRETRRQALEVRLTGHVWLFLAK